MAGKLHSNSEKLQDLQEENNNLNALKDDSAYDYLYEELLEAIKENLEEEIDLAEDDIDIYFEVE